MGISLHGGSVGQPGVGSSTRGFEIWLKGALEVECHSLWELCKGTWREGSLAGDPEGYVEKALEMGISFQRGPILGNLEEGSSTGAFESWMKGALGMEHLSLKRLHGGGLGSSFAGNPGR